MNNKAKYNKPLQDFSASYNFDNRNSQIAQQVYRNKPSLSTSPQENVPIPNSQPDPYSYSQYRKRTGSNPLPSHYQQLTQPKISPAYNIHPNLQHPASNSPHPSNSPNHVSPSTDNANLSRSSHTSIPQTRENDKGYYNSFYSDQNLISSSQNSSAGYRNVPSIIAKIPPSSYQLSPPQINRSVASSNHSFAEISTDSIDRNSSQHPQNSSVETSINQSYEHGNNSSYNQYHNQRHHSNYPYDGNYSSNCDHNYTQNHDYSYSDGQNINYNHDYSYSEGQTSNYNHDNSSQHSRYSQKYTQPNYSNHYDPISPNNPQYTQNYHNGQHYSQNNTTPQDLKNNFREPNSEETLASETHYLHRHRSSHMPPNIAHSSIPTSQRAPYKKLPVPSLKKNAILRQHFKAEQQSLLENSKPAASSSTPDVRLNYDSNQVTNFSAENINSNQAYTPIETPFNSFGVKVGSRYSKPVTAYNSEHHPEQYNNSVSPNPIYLKNPDDSAQTNSPPQTISAKNATEMYSQSLPSSPEPLSPVKTLNSKKVSSRDLLKLYKSESVRKANTLSRSSSYSPQDIDAYRNKQFSDVYNLTSKLKNMTMSRMSTKSPNFENSNSLQHSASLKAAPINFNSVELSVSSSVSIKSRPLPPNPIILSQFPCYSPTCSRDSACYSPSCRIYFNTILKSQLLNNSQSNLSSKSSIKHSTNSNTRYNPKSPSLSLADKDEKLELKGTSPENNSIKKFNSMNDLQKSLSKLEDTPKNIPATKRKLWSQTVPAQIVEKLTKNETTRQELIYELISTEREFIEDLLVLNNVFRNGIILEQVMELSQQQIFIESVFKNLSSIISTNTYLYKDSVKRQNQDYVVGCIGDIFIKHIPDFECYIEYAANQPFSKYVLDEELLINSRLREFIKSSERSPECRKLPIQSFLSRPSSRLARYPLLFGAILKKTPKDHPDHNYISKCIEGFKALLTKINQETGKLSNKIELYKISDRLVCTPTEKNDLDLLNENRKIVRTGVLKKKQNSTETETAMLFDHMLIFCKEKKYPNNRIEYILCKPPASLSMLSLEYQLISERPQHQTQQQTETMSQMQPQLEPQEQNQHQPTQISKTNSSLDHPDKPNNSTDNYQSYGKNNNGGVYQPPPYFNGNNSEQLSNTEQKPNAAYSQRVVESTMSQSVKYTSIAKPAPVPALPQKDVVKYNDPNDKTKIGYPLTIKHLGKHGGIYTYYLSSFAEMNDWINNIEEQQRKNSLKTRLFFEVIKVAPTLPLASKATCATFIDNGRYLILGSENGLFLGTIGDLGSFVKLNFITHDRIVQVEAIEKYNCLLLLCDKDRYVMSYPLDMIKPAINQINSQYDRNVDYKNLQVKGEKLHSHVNFFKFGVCMNIDILCMVKNTTLRSQSTIHIYRPTKPTIPSVMDNKKMAKGCDRGFEIVDLPSMLTQSLLDPVDESLNFVLGRKDNMQSSEQGNNNFMSTMGATGSDNGASQSVAGQGRGTQSGYNIGGSIAGGSTQTMVEGNVGGQGYDSLQTPTLSSQLTARLLRFEM
ncbi:hypothetical protein BB561_006271 [Smittium simulii]|uniref:DH domain-containing protein n=1 Tax=Smittium simulii TaxID=133385 RepID=A0A2T9Y5G5_9FUNG|nr:hypothetical protein BB561_006271 [Smittium simulii]